MKIFEKRTDRQQIIFLLPLAAAGPKGKILKFDSTPFSPKGGTKYFFMDFYDVNLKKTKKMTLSRGGGRAHARKAQQADNIQHDSYG